MPKKLPITLSILLVTTTSFSVFASAQTPTTSALQADLTKRSKTSFDAIIKNWENRYGSNAVTPLLQLAANKKNNDMDRYVAIMGAAKLGGTNVAPSITPFLKDRSWMIRNASLRALSALENKTTATAILPLLKDPALVIRSEAVDAIIKLRPDGAEDALIAALEDSKNYRAGKAQWVPQKALAALVQLKAVKAAPKLEPLLRHEKDPEIRQKAREAIEALNKIKSLSSQ
jgi:HEAT repeat protein